MRGSVSFNPNNAILTQNIHEDTGRVINHILPKLVQNWLKNHCIKKGLVYFKFTFGLLSLNCWKDVPVEFFIC